MAEPTSQTQDKPAPETQAPEVEAPEVEAPEQNTPQTQRPEMGAPETEAPRTVAPAGTAAGQPAEPAGAADTPDAIRADTTAPVDPAPRVAAAAAQPPTSATPQPPTSATPQPSTSATPQPPTSATPQPPANAPARRSDSEDTGTDGREVDAPRPGTTERTGSWAAVVVDPGHAVELLALAAVAAIGPRAQAWERSTREAYPTADAEGLARLAVRRCVRRAGVGSAAAAATGVLAPVVGVAAQAWTHAELVLHVAAAYGLDPSDPARAADLLVLTQVYPGHPQAQAALASASAGHSASAGDSGSGEDRRTDNGSDRDTTGDSDPDTGGGAKQPPPEGVWRLVAPMAVQAGGWLAARTLARGVPGAALMFAALGGRTAAERLASRALAHYRRTAAG
ncbi:MAG TPA: hypothetical protein VF755_28895 [Catenuloplanes sp.]